MLNKICINYNKNNISNLNSASSHTTNNNLLSMPLNYNQSSNPSEKKPAIIHDSNKNKNNPKLNFRKRIPSPDRRVTRIFNNHMQHQKLNLGKSNYLTHYNLKQKEKGDQEKNLAHFDIQYQQVLSDPNPSLKNLMRRIELRNKQKTLIFSFVEIVRLLFCFKLCRTQSLTTKYKLYEKSQNAILEFMDISFIIQKLEEFEKMKLITFNSEQLALFNFLTKELISLNQEKSDRHIMNQLINFNKNKENLAYIIMKFKEKMMRNENIKEIDKKLYSLIYDELK
jgi:hypothetical protein